MARPPLIHFFVSCSTGLEALLEQELEERGIGRKRRQTKGGVLVTGVLRDVYRANLELGLAHRVRVQIGSFRATNPGVLQEEAAKLPWEQWLAPDEPVRYVAKSTRSRVYHTGAIIERIQRVAQREALTGEDNQGAPRITIRIERDKVDIGIDTSGEALHRRGYRLQSAKAPLREDLACALLRSSGWDRQSPIVDPLMGSGTLLIEAALLAQNKAPGSFRNFRFESLPNFNAGLWTSVKHTAAGKAKETALRFYGSDRDPGALQAAQGNAERAGVTNMLSLSQDPLSEAPGLQSAAMLVTNPPWGKRIGKGADGVKALYHQLRQLRQEEELAFATVAPEQAPTHLLGQLTPKEITDAGGTKVRFFCTAKAEK